jgi:hypothetical protein
MKFPKILILAALVLGIVIPSALARIHVVTLPKRDSVQLTIYNSVDLTLVRETRFLTFRKGINRLEFSWANTLIDPTSVEFRALSRADEVEVLDVSFPPRLTNTLEWRIQSEFSGEVQVEIRYFTSGIQWSADYVAEAASNESEMGFKGFVRINNQSGEDYENAQIRLVVGVVKLVEEIAQLAQQGRPGGIAGRERSELASKRFGEKSKMLFRAMDSAVAAAPAALEMRGDDMVKEGVSEYFLYTVAGRDTIPHGWSKRIMSVNATNVALVSHYKFEQERWGNEVIRFYKFKNDKKSNLGKEPLPDGEVMALRVLPKESFFSFVGKTSVKYIPIDEEVEMNLGGDREVLVKPKLMNWEKSDLRFDARGNIEGFNIKETWEVEVQNSKEIPVTVDYRKSFQGDWTLTSQQAHEKMDATKVKFVLPLKPFEKKSFTLEVVTKHGTNKTR